MEHKANGTFEQDLFVRQLGKDEAQTRQAVPGTL